MIQELLGEPAKSPNFENLEHQEFYTDLNDSNFSKKPKDRSIFAIFF